MLDVLLAAPGGTVLSLNVPDRPVAELRELREARLATFGTVQVRVDHREHDDGAALHASFEELTTPPEPGTDTALLADGHPTLTELVSVAERPGVLNRLLERVVGRPAPLTRPGQCWSAPVSRSSSRSATSTTRRNGRSKPSSGVSPSGTECRKSTTPPVGHHATHDRLPASSRQPCEIDVGHPCPRAT